MLVTGGPKVATYVDITSGPGEKDTLKQVKQKSILPHFIIYTLPQVKRLIKEWKTRAEGCSDPILRHQALKSIAGKTFHCQGGAVYSVLYPAWEKELLRVIIAYQTICDYLDNLCDRAGSNNPTAFLQLHQALFDALTPGKRKIDYYKYYPYQNDNGYLDRLVAECRLIVAQFPSYRLVYNELIKLAGYYSQLQVRKHMSDQKREKSLIGWVEKHLASCPGLLWQEFAAASGSTLALFALLGAATDPYLNKNTVKRIVKGYFPWICGLHILLDYFIDQAEDRVGGDLNFVFYYNSPSEIVERLQLFVAEAHKCAATMPDPFFHHTVVEGLLAMYLSDRKISEQQLFPAATVLLNQSGPRAWKTYRICSLVRKIF
jgi:tetraprenyl-beta-curcumene synthase